LAPLRTNVEPVGTKDGNNATFTIPNSEAYLPQSLSVFLNGQMYRPGSIEKISPSYTQFTITGDNLPLAEDDFTVTYMVKLQS